MTPWNPAIPTAPSRAIERDAVADIAYLLDVPACGRAGLRDAVMAREGRAVIMHADGGWGAGAEFAPRMLMSFERGGIDYAVPVHAHPAGRGELYLVDCGPSPVHIAYWPNCGNLSRLELREPGVGTPHIETPPVPVGEPGTGLLLIAGLMGWLLWRLSIRVGHGGSDAPGRQGCDQRPDIADPYPAEPGRIEDAIDLVDAARLIRSAER